MNKIISKEKLLSAGVHYGHQTRSWNAAMKPFIKGSKNNIHVINLDISALSIENSYKVVKRIADQKGSFLFVGTTKNASNTIKENAERIGESYINYRWLGGLLTNFKTIQNSVRKLKNLERLAETGFDGYTKKEAILLKKELVKLERSIGGIKNMRTLPQAIFVSSIRNEEIAIREAKKINIPIFGIADTNVDPNKVNFPIFGNDDATKSVSLITTIIADAIAESKGQERLAAFVEDDSKFRILGYVENNTKEDSKELNEDKDNKQNINNKTKKEILKEGE
jgi:small subunit ribosomal protein S2